MRLATGSQALLPTRSGLIGWRGHSTPAAHLHSCLDQGGVSSSYLLIVLLFAGFARACAEHRVGPFGLPPYM
jgi:hypothetical protein